MGLLIDTSVIVTLERTGRAFDSFLGGLSPEDDFAIAAITASELLLGVERAAPENRRLQREAFVNYVLTRIRTLAFDLEIARVHAHISGVLLRSGQMIGAHDLLIGATALANEYSLLTQNVSEFSRVPGLDVRQPAW